MLENEKRLLYALQVAAYVVIVAWGIKTTSHLLLVLLISLFLAYVIVPLPRWLIHRFRLRMPAALGATIATVCAAYAVISVLVYTATVRMMVKLPGYEQQFIAVYETSVGFLNSHGTHFANASSVGFLSPDRIAEFTINMLPTAVGAISDRLLTWLLSLLFLVQIVEQEESKRTAFASGLIKYGGDIERFITISARTGAITALANLVLLSALGVDFPVLWSFLYFILQFIPSVGFLIALVPPTLLALLGFGWKRALLVGGGLVLTQLMADYLLLPRFMRKGLHVSLFEIMLSLLVWGFLLGPWGGVLAVPLTLALRRFIAEHSKEGAPIPA